VREDLVCEAIARAYVSLVRLSARGKLDVAYPSPLARFACKQIKASRRVGNRPDLHDLLSQRAQREGQFVHGLYERDERGRWQELLVEDRRAKPADVAIVRVDFTAWLSTLSLRLRRIAEVLASGESTNQVAERFQVTAGRVSQLRAQLERSWEMFQGELVATKAA
jgi:hypothetical protein